MAWGREEVTRPKLHEILKKFQDLPGECLNMEVKITRHPSWTEIRVFGKLRGIPTLRGRPIQKV